MGKLCLYDLTRNMILIRLKSYTVMETEIGRLIDCPLTKKYAPAHCVQRMNLLINHFC